MARWRNTVSYLTNVSQKLMSAAKEPTSNGEQQSEKTEKEQPEKKSNEDDRLKVAEEAEPAVKVQGKNCAKSEGDKLLDDMESMKLISPKAAQESTTNGEQQHYKNTVEQPQKKSNEDDQMKTAAEFHIPTYYETLATRKLEKLPDDFESMKHRYKFVSLIGFGCGADVYEVVTEQQQHLALKLTPGGYDLYRDCIIMKMAASITSPHFAKLEDAGKIGKNYFVALDLLGPTLDQIVNKNSSDVKLLQIVDKIEDVNDVKLLFMAKQSLKGIADLHTLGYAHCDIKGDNFAVGRVGSDKEQIVFTIDFGLCESIKKSEVKIVSDEYKEIPLKKDDLVWWFKMVMEWFKVKIWHEYKDKSSVQLRLAGDPKVREKNMAKLREMKQELQGFRYIYMTICDIKTNDSIDYSYMLNTLDLMIQETSNFTAIEWETGKSYVEPVASTISSINLKYDSWDPEKELDFTVFND